jgi:DNA-binding CsgD family transcriptional regulator
MDKIKLIVMKIMRKKKSSRISASKNKKINRKRAKAANAIILDQIKSLANSFTVVEKSLETTNKRVDKLSEMMEKQVKFISEQKERQSPIFRAKTEQPIELPERSLDLRMKSERLSRKDGQLRSIRGRHREILAMLINNGFHTYEQIAQKLGISQSRARAYIADLRNNYGVPLKQVRDPEGYKIGVDTRFVEQILTSK